MTSLTTPRTHRIPRPRRVYMEKIEKMEDRLRAVENAAIQTGAALASIAKNVDELKSMFADSLRESKAVERRVDQVETTTATLAAKLEKIEQDQTDLKKLAMKIAGVALVILLGLAGVKNVPLEAILPESTPVISRSE